jgi:hypothetical protein
MTREDRWIVSLDEIRAIRWECGKCHVALSFALNQTISLPGACPSCNADALDPSIQEHRAYGEFVKALKVVIEHQRSNNNPGTVRLEFLADPARR